MDNLSYEEPLQHYKVALSIIGEQWVENIHLKNEIKNLKNDIAGLIFEDVASYDPDWQYE